MRFAPKKGSKAAREKREEIGVSVWYNRGNQCGEMEGCPVFACHSERSGRICFGVTDPSASHLRCFAQDDRAERVVRLCGRPMAAPTTSPGDTVGRGFTPAAGM